MSTDWTMPFSIDAAILPLMKPQLPSKPRPPSKPPATSTQLDVRRNTRAASSARQSEATGPSAAMPSMDDEATFVGCLTAIADQDQRALGRFYDLTVNRVYAVALRVVRRIDLAEEVVSDVYVQVWRDAHRYDTARGRVLGWLLIIARSRALDLLRRQDEAFSHPDPYELIAEPESTQHQPEDLLMAAQAGGAVHAALQALNPLQRQLLSQAFFRGLSHQEIAEQGGLPLGTVKTHIRRALGELRKALGKDATFGDLS